MADVFLSYSKARRELTEALAQDLLAEGISVWWDTSLLPADNFRDEIDRQLDLARAVVIIWTPESIVSRWVRAEADHADRDNKLVNTHTTELDPHRIPKPFNQINSAELKDRAAIIAAVKKLGAKRSLGPPLYPALPSSPPSQGGVLDAVALEHWQAIKASNDPQRLRDFLTEFAGAKLAMLARARLAELEAVAWAGLQMPRRVDALRTFLMDFPDGANAEAAQADLMRVENTKRKQHLAFGAIFLALAGLSAWIMYSLIADEHVSRLVVFPFSVSTLFFLFVAIAVIRRHLRAPLRR